MPQFSELGRGGVFFIGSASDNSTRALTTNSTWEDVSGTSITWYAIAGINYAYFIQSMWRTASANFIHHNWRILVDGATTGTTPTEAVITQEDASVSGERFTSSMLFSITGLAEGQHTVKLQSYDGGSSVDRTFENTFAWLLQVS